MINVFIGLRRFLLIYPPPLAPLGCYTSQPLTFSSYSNYVSFLQKRGHNIVVIDRNGKLMKRASFDTHGHASSGSQMAKFINKIRWGRIVLIAVQDDGSKYIANATAALATLGATEPYTLGFRSSWAFIGMKGNNNFEFKRQAAKPRYEGPTHIYVRMNTQPLYTGPPVLPRRKLGKR